MTWPFIYHPGDRLSGAELSAARLDGDIVEIGEAFMPADAVETRELRAGSLTSVAGSSTALTHESAAWVHGASDRLPARHSIQRCVDTRISEVIDRRIRYRDLRLPPADTEYIAGVAVASPTRTLVDLLRDRVLREGGDVEPVKALAAWRPELIRSAIAWFDAAGPVPFKRQALALLSGGSLRTR